MKKWTIHQQLKHSRSHLHLHLQVEKKQDLLQRDLDYSNLLVAPPLVIVAAVPHQTAVEPLLTAAVKRPPMTAAAVAVPLLTAAEHPPMTVEPKLNPQVRPTVIKLKIVAVSNLKIAAEI